MVNRTVWCMNPFQRSHCFKPLSDLTLRSVFTVDIVQLLIDRNQITTFKGINGLQFSSQVTQKKIILLWHLSTGQELLLKWLAIWKKQKQTLLQTKIRVHYNACWSTVNCAEQMCNNTFEVHSKSKLIQRSNINFLRVSLMGCQTKYKFWHISLATSNVH